MNTHDFTVLHNRLYGKVFSFVRLRVHDSEEVKDIVQDVFIRAYKTWQNKEIDSLDENVARNFLFMLARQRMIDLWRSGRNRLQTDLYNKTPNGEENQEFADFDTFQSDEPMPEEVFSNGESKTLVLSLLNQLKIEERELLVYRFLQELEYKELADIYKIGEDSIRQRVSRALQNLKKVAKKNNQEKQK